MWKNQESKKWVSLQDVYMANERYNPQCNLIRRTFILSILLPPSLHIALLVVFIVYTFKIACKSFLPLFMLHHLSFPATEVPWELSLTCSTITNKRSPPVQQCLHAQRQTVDFYPESLSCTSILDLLKKFWWCKFVCFLHNQGKGDTFESFQREIPAACFLK